MKRREFTKSAAASVALSPLSQIDVHPDDEGEPEEEEILLRMSTERFERLKQKGELYQVDRGIWRFIPERNREQ